MYVETKHLWDIQNEIKIGPIYIQTDGGLAWGYAVVNLRRFVLTLSALFCDIESECDNLCGLKLGNPWAKIKM